jgi:apolipoprotein N-acyltransferase
MQEVLPGEASEPAQGQGEDALPGLRLSPSRTGLPLALPVAALSGALLSLSLPPAGLWPLAFLAPIPLLWLLRSSGLARGALIGFTFGVFYFGAVLYWILLFGELAFVMLVLASGAYVATFGALAPALWRPERPVLSTLGLSALWTAIEWIRGAFPLGGFTWGQLGASQVDGPTLPLASVTGVWGVSFIVLLVAGSLLLAIEWWGSGVRRPALALVACAALVLLPAFIPIPAPNGPKLDVATIQVDVESVEDLDGIAEDIAIARLNVERHVTLRNDPPDLVVWGEAALDPGATADAPTFAAVTDAIASVGAPTLAGAVVNDPDGRQRTSTIAFDGSGRPVDRYDKVHLVPFGEYVPWRSLLRGRINAIDQVPIDRAAGTDVRNLLVNGLPEIGAPICFENSFPSIDRAMVRQGAELLVLTINNASYERTAASAQHLQMSRLRAVENGRSVIHAAISGISAYIDQRGRVVDTRGLFEPALMRHDVVASTRQTLYTRFGDWMPLGSVVLVGILFALPRSRRRPRRQPPALTETPRVLVVLPTYNEKETIGRVLDGLLELPYAIHVLVVDDGSPDGTAAIVRARAQTDDRVRLAERDRKLGLASAYGVGFDRGIAEGYDLVVEMDSDLSHDPHDLPGLLEAARSNDLVIGSRYVPGGSVSNWSRARLALSRAGNAYVRLWLGLGVRDATSGFRAYRRQALETVLQRPVTSDGYGFQVELVFRAWNEGLSIAEAPITFRERSYGQSKISRRIVLEALWQVAKWGFRARFRPRSGW